MGPDVCEAVPSPQALPRRGLVVSALQDERVLVCAAREVRGWQPRRAPSVPAWPELLGAASRSAVHLEMRDSYAVDYEKGPFAQWRAGFRHDPADRASWWRPWLDLIQKTVSRGVVVRRARVVSEPVSE